MSVVSAQQWKAIIENRPDWVEIVTWNDFNESYICPVDPPGTARAPSYVQSRPSHAGYLELNRYYIEWYKTGGQPAPRDALFYFYRPHPRDAVAGEDKPVKSMHGEGLQLNSLSRRLPARRRTSSSKPGCRWPEGPPPGRTG